MPPVTLAIDLSGRRALVTGAGQGVGRGIIDALALAGAAVVVNDLVAERAEAVAADMRATGADASAAPFDVTDAAAVAAGVAAAGPIDILVNNAGNAGDRPQTLVTFADTQPPDWEPYLRVNLYGVLHCTHAALPGMVERGWGRVITIVSDAGRVGDPGMAVYGAAKAGAAGFCRSLAPEVGRHGVTVNSIALGTMRTPLTEGLWAGDDVDLQTAILRRYAIRRPGQPEDVATLVALLASPAASWITGQTYPVNGGSSSAL